MFTSDNFTRTLLDGDSGFKRIQQALVQGAEEGEEPGELDRVALQLVHCPCYDHSWGQGFDPVTGCLHLIITFCSLKIFCNTIFLDKRSAISSFSKRHPFRIQVSQIIKNLSPTFALRCLLPQLQSNDNNFALDTANKIFVKKGWKPKAR